jgi:hypothetical protein
LQVPILIFSRVNILHGARQQFAPRWGGRAGGQREKAEVWRRHQQADDDLSGHPHALLAARLLSDAYFLKRLIRF